MNTLLTTLIDVLRFSASFRESQDALKVVHPSDILVDICSKHLTKAQIDQLADSIVACTEGRSDALPSLDAIEPFLSGAELEIHLAQTSAALNELRALRFALRPGRARRVSLNITSGHFFDYLQEFYIGAEFDRPKIVLVGTLLSLQDTVDIQLDSSNRLLSRIAISYSGRSVYPYLSLKLWSASKIIHALAERPDWYQKDGPDYDLNLWSRYGDKIKGGIRTRLVTLPHVIDGERISMSFAATTGLELYETSVVDGHGNILATCLRAARYASQ
jgi:hypothetical protein